MTTFDITGHLTKKMIESREEVYYGVWFLPDSEIKLQGRLTVSENFIDLHLTDPQHYSFIKTDSLDIQKFPIIYGLGQHREFITLYDCTGNSGDFSANLMLYGDKHFADIETLRFKIMSVNLPYFDKWMNPGSFKKEVSKDGFTIKYENPEKIDFELNEEIKLNIDFDCFIPDTRDKNKIVLHEYSYIQLISNNQEGSLLTSFLKNLTYLQQLVSFLFRDGANIDVIRVYSTPEDYSKNRYMGIMVFGLHPFNKYAHTEYGLHPLINYATVKKQLELFVKSWFAFAKDGQHIINLILQDYFYKGVFDENRFLNLIRVLEIYHAFRFPGTKLPPQEFKEKLNAIIEAIPEQYKIEVKDYLSHFNDYSLDMRLRALVAEVKVDRIGMDYKLDDDFIKNVKWSRNYYTHYNPSNEKKALKREGLIKLTETCRALINFLVLKQLGVSEEILTETFRYYFEHSYYSNYFL